jgi:thioredoxin 1
LKVVREPEFKTEVLQYSGKALVNFHANWSSSSIEQKPFLNSLEAELKESTGEQSSIKFFQVDVNNSLNLTALFNVEIIPTVILFENGNQIHRAGGLQTESDLREILDVKN